MYPEDVALSANLLWMYLTEPESYSSHAPLKIHEGMLKS